MLEGLPSPKEINVSVAQERSASITITDRQSKEFSAFLQEAGILTQPKVIAWTEYEGEDDIIFTSWQYGARNTKEQNV